MAADGTSDLLIYMDSVYGKQLLHEVQTDSSTGVYQPIVHRIFTQQSTGASCGIQSCALLLSADVTGQCLKSAGSPWNVNFSSLSTVSLSPTAGNQSPALPYTDLKLYEMPETRRVTDRQRVSQRGTTLDEVASILRAHGRTASVVYADLITADRFRQDVVAALSASDSRSGVIVNFIRSRLKTGTEMKHWAHHSPLVAYHHGYDGVLVLDTAAPLHRHFWVKIESMFSAMSTVDRSVMKSRGYVVSSSSFD